MLELFENKTIKIAIMGASVLFIALFIVSVLYLIISSCCSSSSDDTPCTCTRVTFTVIAVLSGALSVLLVGSLLLRNIQKAPGHDLRAVRTMLKAKEGTVTEWRLVACDQVGELLKCNVHPTTKSTAEEMHAEAIKHARDKNLAVESMAKWNGYLLGEFMEPDGAKQVGDYAFERVNEATRKEIEEWIEGYEG